MREKTGVYSGEKLIKLLLCTTTTTPSPVVVVVCGFWRNGAEILAGRPLTTSLILVRFLFPHTHTRGVFPPPRRVRARAVPTFTLQPPPSPKLARRPSKHRRRRRRGSITTTRFTCQKLINPPPPPPSQRRIRAGVFFFFFSFW